MRNREAGNRASLTYPGGTALTYTPTALNQVDQIKLGVVTLADYGYTGRLLTSRQIITDNTPSQTSYGLQLSYDNHRRVGGLTDTVDIVPGPGMGLPSSQVIASYTFTYDNRGDPLSQSASQLGLPGFSADSRTYTHDRLNRLLTTTYAASGTTESGTLDIAGNRQTYTGRDGETINYTLASPGPNGGANEYATINGMAVMYDAAGNLSVDEDGRKYFYDEQNRLTLVTKADNTPLQSYAYDALARRVTSKDELGNFKVRYYYDGQSVIEERNDATDLPGSATAGLLRYHIHGGQYVDEHIATFTVATNSYRYYLHNRLWSVAGTGDKTGSSSITQLDYSSGGSFAGSVATPVHHDSDNDDDVDLRDFDDFAHCFGTTTSGCLARHDFGTASTADGQINLTDHIGFVNCFGGRFGDLPPTCTAGTVPPSGSFTLHGAMLDVVPDGKTLEYGRSRYLDIKHGRWLQRDPVPYNDSFSLYEAFRSNPVANTDPSGEGILTWLLAGIWNASDIEFIRAGGVQSTLGAYYGGLGESSFHVVIGAGKNAREVGYVFADAGVSAVDIPATLLGHPINYTLRSSIGRASAFTSETGAITLRVAGTGAANLVTLGAYNTVTGTIEYVRTGDDVALAENVGGPAFLSLVTVGVSKSQPLAPRILGLSRSGLQVLSEVAPAGRTSQVTFLRAGLAIERAQFALETPAASQLNAFALNGLRSSIIINSSGGRGLPIGTNTILFGQRRANPTFSFKERVPDWLKGQDLRAVADALRSGGLSADAIQIEVFEQPSGEFVSINTRGFAAFVLAGRRPTNVTVVEPSAMVRARLDQPGLVPGQQLPGRLLPVTDSQGSVLYVVLVME